MIPPHQALLSGYASCLLSGGCSFTLQWLLAIWETERCNTLRWTSGWSISPTVAYLDQVCLFSCRFAPCQALKHTCDLTAAHPFSAQALTLLYRFLHDWEYNYSCCTSSYTLILSKWVVSFTEPCLHRLCLPAFIPLPPSLSHVILCIFFFFIWNPQFDPSCPWHMHFYSLSQSIETPVSQCQMSTLLIETNNSLWATMGISFAFLCVC